MRGIIVQEAEEIIFLTNVQPRFRHIPDAQKSFLRSKQETVENFACFDRQTGSRVPVPVLRQLSKFAGKKAPIYCV